MSNVLDKTNLHELSIAPKISTHDEKLYECTKCGIFFHRDSVESATEINPHENLGEVRAVEDKPNNESIKVDERGTCNFHFIDEHHGKVDGINTEYDASKFKQILENYSKLTEPNQLFECLPSNLRPPSDDEGSDGKSHDPQSNGLGKTDYTVPTIIPPTVLPVLHDLAQQMVKAGHQQELFKTYRDIRRAVLAQSLEKLGVERHSKYDVERMNQDVFEAKIMNWIHYIRISVKLLFAAEKEICHQILDGVEPFRDQSFAEITTISFGMLLSFGYAIAISRRSPEKVFVILDMYEIMIELQPEFELIFGSKPCTEMKEDALNLTKLLAQTVKETIADFEVAIEMDATETVVMDGSVHALTSYVARYVKFLFDYEPTLRQLFQEFNSNDPDTKLKSVMTGIMRALRNNLDGKSRQFEDAALTQLFLMNNVYYIVRNFRREEAKNFLGDDLVQTHRRIVQQHAKQYQTISWNKILQCITVQSSKSGLIKNESIKKTLVKEKFKTFNSQFEELHQRQCQWSVSDVELRESLRLAIAEVLLPAYGSFLKRFGPMIESGKNSQKYIRFTPEDLERMLNDFFQGKNLDVSPKR
ncbi:exocyst subunit exo70 family protein A3 [Arabidopsis thaliana]|uniref:Exocyst complex component EXO70A3 n=1 Tax=Arabidopsis thaliana TaxID=3702 RepID=E70A3_ARATH|nr:exocyst subunit exo70 family protein A3 [Arabidopsis thaliana]F4KG58.1 RecName: Full=Exocyst complex component EXO70A3; Short=AtExo70a3; AltName: Full=Exocyst subunit Exo70 family protein A3 [Arabidopsis thaliana]AED96204.1 exocyst subunit exo70 family protein A3 [Arabidopsis thaliana]|eukprot:NP_200048.2 exocyst subunit exo70 family protein A3 [Arabidopsis thaliana]